MIIDSRLLTLSEEIFPGSEEEISGMIISIIYGELAHAW